MAVKKNKGSEYLLGPLWENIRYSVFGGIRKNLHLPYYIHGFGMLAKPRWITEKKLGSLLQEFDKSSSQEQDYIMDRVNYYNRLSQPINIPVDSPTIGEQSYFKKKCPSVYVFDTFELNRYFPSNLKWLFAPGDIVTTFNLPTIAKSRPIKECLDNPNTILVNLDKVRHFMFFKDPIPFEKKSSQVIFRGAVHGKPTRMLFIEKYFGHPQFNIFDTSTNSIYPEEMRLHTETSIYDHLKFKYILSLEGNDVASNLKWIMNSNSIAVSPPLNYETWFMEGRLKPGKHFIEVKPDFSNILEQIAYYESHPEEARKIIENAHQHCRQFFDKKRERLIALMVMRKYFMMTGQI
jgi:hypothetical protein